MLAEDADPLRRRRPNGRAGIEALEGTARAPEAGERRTSRPREESRRWSSWDEAASTHASTPLWRAAREGSAGRGAGDGGSGDREDGPGPGGGPVGCTLRRPGWCALPAGRETRPSKTVSLVDLVKSLLGLSGAAGSARPPTDAPASGFLHWIRGRSKAPHGRAGRTARHRSPGRWHSWTCSCHRRRRAPAPLHDDLQWAILRAARCCRGRFAGWTVIPSWPSLNLSHGEGGGEGCAGSWTAPSPAWLPIPLAAAAAGRGGRTGGGVAGGVLPPEEADRVVTRLHRESMGNPLLPSGRSSAIWRSRESLEPPDGSALASSPVRRPAGAPPPHPHRYGVLSGPPSGSFRKSPRVFFFRLVLAPEGIHPGRPGEDGAKPGEAPAQGVAGLLGRGLVRWNAEGALIFSHDEVRGRGHGGTGGSETPGRGGA